MTPPHAARRRALGRLLVGLVALGSLGGCSSAPDKRALQYMNQEGYGRRYVGNAEEENYVSIGDQVIVFDVAHPDQINSTQTVDIDGTILLPEVGAVKVAGYTRSDLQAVLTERYAVYFEETEIVVDIRTQGKTFWVLGEVRGEGEKPFTGDITVFDAVMKADPRRDSANLGRVVLVRGDPQDPLVLPVNVRDILRGDTTTNYGVRENDIVYVPPTLLAQTGYFFDALLFPVKQILRGIGGAIFGNTGGRRRRTGSRGLEFGGIF